MCHYLVFTILVNNPTQNYQKTIKQAQCNYYYLTANGVLPGGSGNNIIPIGNMGKYINMNLTAQNLHATVKTQTKYTY
jgi:hypothetical protein